MEPKDTKNTELFSQQIGDKERLKIQAQKDTQSVWSGLGMFGLVGWSITVPTLLGAGLGMWLDAHYPQSFSWALSLLLVGLFGGCLLAWQWVKKEDQSINQKKKEDE